MPGGRGDIDHITIVPSAIYVIDTKAVTGKVEIRSRWFKPPRLFIGGRDRTSYLDGLDLQITAVRDALQITEYGAAPVQAVLCFTRADLPRLRAVEMRGHLLLYRKARQAPHRKRTAPERASCRTARAPDRRIASRLDLRRTSTPNRAQLAIEASQSKRPALLSAILKSERPLPHHRFRNMPLGESEANTDRTPIELGTPALLSAHLRSVPRAGQRPAFELCGATVRRAF